MMSSIERKTRSLFSKLVSLFLMICSLTIQLLIYYFLIFEFKSMHGNVFLDCINVFITLISYVFVAYIYNCNINTSFKLTWTILILTLPLFGIIFYLFYGNGHSMPKKKSKVIKSYLSSRNNEQSKIDVDIDKESLNVLTGLKNMSQLNYYVNSDAIFYNDALRKHLQFCSDLKSAQKYIFLEYFIFAEGKLLNEIYDILSERGKNGVKIYIIYDDVGSKPTFPNKIKEKFMSIENLSMKAYAPYGKSFDLTMNYRDHRKIAVIDGIYAYCGGDNLADEYIHEKNRFGFWRDNAVRIEGDAVEGFVKMFCEMWYMSSKNMICLDEFVNKNHSVRNNDIIMPFGDGPTYNLHPSYSLFINIIALAKESIYISTPYFIIDKEFINALCRAINNGIDVVILTPHIPDKRNVFYLTREHYKDIIDAGGKVYEFTEGFNHAKNIIVDNKYAFIGTVNIDYRSFFLHFECGVLLINNKIISEMKDDFISTIEKSKLITREEFLKRPYYQRIIAFLLSFFSPLF